MNTSNEGIIRITKDDIAGVEDPDISITEDDLAEVSEPEIKITEADLYASTPQKIKISYRDLAKNPLAWLVDVTKDFSARMGSFHKDARWWGQNKEGKQKIAEYQKAEKEREDIERLLDGIAILPDKPWIELTDRELSEAEINISPEDIVALEKEDLSPEEKTRRDREAWDRLVKERKEFFDTQKSAIQAVYGGKSLQTPIVMETHLSQKYTGQEGIWSCAVASTLNALCALRVAQPEDSEDSIIREMGGREVFSEDGFLPISKADNFLRSRGLVVTPSGNILELLQTLENGGVAVIAYGGHARMISSLEVGDGMVSLRVHDPLGKTRPERTSSDVLMERINQTRSHYNMLLVENISIS